MTRRAIAWLLRRPRHSKHTLTAYHGFFSSDAGKLLLDDLARYCHAQESTFVLGDPYHSALQEGRRNVFLHIKEICAISDAELDAALQQRQDQLHSS